VAAPATLATLVIRVLLQPVVSAVLVVTGSELTGVLQTATTKPNTCVLAVTPAAILVETVIPDTPVTRVITATRLAFLVLITPAAREVTAVTAVTLMLLPHLRKTAAGQNLGKTAPARGVVTVVAVAALLLFQVRALAALATEVAGAAEVPERRLAETLLPAVRGATEVIAAVRAEPGLTAVTPLADQLVVGQRAVAAVAATVEKQIILNPDTIVLEVPVVAVAAEELTP
jgi:hypothetical protein